MADTTNVFTTTKPAANRELIATPLPRARVAKADLAFVSENQQLEGFPGRVSESVAAHQPDIELIARAARKFGAQVPTGAGSKPAPIFHPSRNG